MNAVTNTMQWDHHTPVNVYLSEYPHCNRYINRRNKLVIFVVFTLEKQSVPVAARSKA